MVHMGFGACCGIVNNNVVQSLTVENETKIKIAASKCFLELGPKTAWSTALCGLKDTFEKRIYYTQESGRKEFFVVSDDGENVIVHNWNLDKDLNIENKVKITCPTCIAILRELGY